MGHYADFDPHPARDEPLSAACTRPARREDAESLLEIWAERHVDPQDETAPDVEDALRRIRGELEGIGQGKPWQVFVAEVDGTVVAYGRVRCLDHAEAGLPLECPEGWYLTGVIVRPAWRRRGLGALLTQARLDWVRERSSAVHYVSNKQNRVSIALHERFGFVPTDAEFAYPRAQLEFGEGVLHTLTLTQGD